MPEAGRALTVLQAKFSAYLAWSQPFIHNLVSALGDQVRNVVVCNRTENLDRFPTPTVVRLRHRFLVEPSPGLRAAAYLSRHYQPDLIHAHFGWSGIRMLFLKQFLRIPLVTTFGGRDVAVQMKLPAFDRLYQILLDATEWIICVSDDLRTELVAAGVDGKRIEVIRRGTSLARFAFVDRAERDPQAPVRVLMVGRLIEKKGHRYALEALAALAREGQGARLTVVGEGEDYAELRRLQRSLGLEHVEFVGVTDQQGVRDQMAAADVFLHCSVTGADGDREGIPNVVVEAAATGLPVIGTRHGGIGEPVLDGETGLLVEERDVPGLTAALRRLVTDRAARLDLGRAGHRRMTAEFDLDKQVARHLEIYRILAREFPAGTERLRGGRLPADFSDLLDRALAYEKEFSVAELFERLVSPSALDADILAPEPGLVARLYEVKRFVPQGIKWPAKVALGRILARVIAARIRLQRRYGEQLAQIDSLNQLVLRHVEAGGSIEEIDPAWGAEQLARYLTGVKRTRSDPPGEGEARP
jgi:glycosyltransferase involved in cell wall biosynthesis